MREDAVEALRLLGKREAWGPLVKATEDKDYKVRNAAMDALAFLDSPKNRARCRRLAELVVEEER